MKKLSFISGAVTVSLIGEGLEDIEKLRKDSTVVESNIYYPTNNSLIGIV